MTHSDFQIGIEFISGSRRFRCTDVGTRTIAAVCLTEHAEDDSWFTGPPYAVVERVFDEYDIEGCAGVEARAPAAGPEPNAVAHSEPAGSTWRYQAYRDTDGTVRVYEDYFDESGDWEARTEGSIAPMGETVEQLVRNLHHMLRDVAAGSVKDLKASDGL